MSYVITFSVILVSSFLLDGGGVSFGNILFKIFLGLLIGGIISASLAGLKKSLTPFKSAVLLAVIIVILSFLYNFYAEEKARQKELARIEEVKKQEEQRKQKIENEKKKLEKNLLAANNGDVNAMYEAGNYYMDYFNNYNEAVNWFAKAAGHGSVKAMYRLYRYYANQGRDKDKFIYWAEMAANHDSIDACYILGSYYAGKGTPLILNRKDKDINKAVFWYTKAADRGNIQSACELYLIHVKSTNYKEAHKWLSFIRSSAGGQFTKGLDEEIKNLRSRKYYLIPNYDLIRKIIMQVR